MLGSPPPQVLLFETAGSGVLIAAILLLVLVETEIGS